MMQIPPLTSPEPTRLQLPLQNRFCSSEQQHELKLSQQEQGTCNQKQCDVEPSGTNSDQTLRIPISRIASQKCQAPLLDSITKSTLNQGSLSEKSTGNKINEKSTDAIHVGINSHNILKYCLILSLCGFPFGWDVGTSSATISNEFFPYQNLSSLEFGLIVSCFHFGCSIGSVCLGQWKINLKTLLHITISLYALAAALEVIFLYCTQLYIWGYIIGRFFGGISCGGLGVIGPLYMNELIIGGSNKRLYLSFHQTVVASTIFIANGISWISTDWPDLIYLYHYSKLLYSICFHSLLWFLPKSIRYFSMRQDYPQLWTIYNKLIYNLNESVFMQIIKTPDTTDSSVLDRCGIKKLIICCIILICQQLTGINYFFYYGSIIFKSQSIIVVLCLVNLLASLSSGWVINRYSIRYILIAASFLMCGDLVVYANVGQFTNMYWLLITMTFTFIVLYAISWGSGAGILVNISSNGSSTIMSWATATSWLANWIITMVSPWMVVKLGFLYGYIFSGFLIILGLFIFWCIE